MADSTVSPAAIDVDMDPLPDASHPDPSSSSDDDDEHLDDSPPDGPDLQQPLDADLYHVSEASQRARDRKEHLVQQLLMKRRASALAVPTNDTAVQERLRHFGHPVTLPGEREMERRDRLRAIMAKLDADGELDKLVQAQEDVPADDVPPLQLFYTEGSPELLLCRKEVLRFSLPRSRARIERAKRKRADPDEDEDAETEEVLKCMADTSLDCSEIGDGRPLSSCAFSPDASLLATG